MWALAEELGLCGDMACRPCVYVCETKGGACGSVLTMSLLLGDMPSQKTVYGKQKWDLLRRAMKDTIYVAI